MMRALFRTCAIAALPSLCLLQLGCAGTNPPPNSSASAAVALVAKPDAETTAAPAKPAQAAPASASAPTSASASSASAGDESPKHADEPRDGLRRASRPPVDLLTGNNVVYVLNFAGSKVGESAKERCDSEHSDDPAAAHECFAKERGKLPVESVRFVKSASGEYWWVTYNRYKGNLLKWHSIQFVPGKADADTVSLTLTGKDRGIAPIAHVPAALNIELPNDYSIILSDPEHGPMLFDAKLGLLEPDHPSSRASLIPSSEPILDDWLGAPGNR